MDFPSSYVVVARGRKGKKEANVDWQALDQELTILEDFS